MNKFYAMTCVAGLLAGGAVIEGCSTTNSLPGSTTASSSSYGTIQSIERLPASGGSAVAGTLVGGAVGAVVGHQFGDGKGQDLATVAGAVGGAIAGHEIQQRSQERRAAQGEYRIVVHMQNGDRRTFMQADADSLRVGQQVRVDADRIWR
jgi:outer membrane lipoprotein SlyB